MKIEVEKKLIMDKEHMIEKLTEALKSWLSDKITDEHFTASVVMRDTNIVHEFTVSTPNRKIIKR